MKEVKKFLIEQKGNPVFKTTPYAHQLEAFELGKDKRTFAYLMDMGTGKSKVLIDTASHLYLSSYIEALVIVAPKGVYRNWLGELETHCSVPYLAYYHRPASTIKDKEAYDKFKKEIIGFRGLRVLLINVEALSYSSCYSRYSWFLKDYNTLMAVDESTTIKSPKALRTKEVLRFGTLARYRRILTGQPITQSPLDLYAQCAFLDKRHLQIPSYFAFRARYAIMKQLEFGNRRFMKVTGFQRMDELQEKLKRFSFRVTKEECLDLPPKVYTTREVELTPEQKNLYTQMSKVAVLELESGGIVTASMVMSKLEKLHQIVCGHVRMNDGGPIHRIKSNRVNTVMEILEEANGNVLIWGCYQEDIRMLVSEIEDKYGKETVAAYYGPVSSDEREQIRIRFQDPSDPLRFFVGNPATGKFGLTLSLANLAIYYSNSYSLENRLQSEDRSHRIGSEIHDKITYVDLVAPGTVDEVVLKNLRDKKNVAEMVVSAVENGSWKRLFSKAT